MEPGLMLRASSIKIVGEFGALSMSSPYVTSDELRAYAAGEFGWSTLRDRGIAYQEVLAGLGTLELRPPMAPMTGPNVEARLRGDRLLRAALAAARS